MAVFLSKRLQIRQLVEPSRCFTITTASHRQSSSFASLDHTLRTRKIAPTFDDLTPQPSHRLSISLADFLPSNARPPASRLSPLPSTSSNPLHLPLAHHLVYFEPCKRSSELLSDGTNPDQSPGEPFTRRMWAGGRVRYDASRPLVLDGGRGVCAEFLRSATVKGKEGEEKVFVAVERRIARLTKEENDLLAEAGTAEGHSTTDTLYHRIRQRLWRGDEEDMGPCSIVETRNIVFMRPHTPEQGAQQVKKRELKRPQYEVGAADWCHTLTPDAGLLFRFSALTFNAHAIHLDPGFSRDVEGHRGMLVHGPLSYVLVMTLLQANLSPGEAVKRVEYRNLAPLYCDEPATYCGKRTGENKWDIWALTPDGGTSIKGSVVTEKM